MATAKSGRKKEHVRKRWRDVGCSHRRAHSSCIACWDALGSVLHNTITACSSVLSSTPQCSDSVLLSFVRFPLFQLSCFPLCMLSSLCCFARLCLDSDCFCFLLLSYLTCFWAFCLSYQCKISWSSLSTSQLAECLLWCCLCVLVFKNGLCILQCFHCWELRAGPLSMTSFIHIWHTVSSLIRVIDRLG